MPDLTKDAVLARCPFCGSPARLFCWGEARRAFCSDERCCGYRLAATPEEWNRRARLAPLLDVTGEEELVEQMAKTISGAPFASARSRSKARALLPIITARVAQARAEEREACALVAEAEMLGWLNNDMRNQAHACHHVAKTIRALKETTND